jgi:hypothetical protein
MWNKGGVMKEYPTFKELDVIKKLAALNTITPLIEMFKEIWWNADTACEFEMEGNKWTLELHTGGWSGNEDIIEALAGSMFWFLFWQKSERGGHFYFAGEIGGKETL